ncbi:hypothetical protein A3A14_01445 [Candidatus Daviesbacteria bacterium RIFCSPLOWO2_01_FULL_43_38]|nr:MAG: hypothetical protein A2874_01205 [Candidatus Daviesbacteria bacterium RIFCSPHIGHO2_01_FULL_43_17]OGE63860.1 MAG: hypothetical protein A3A14_01445 [Candidatus Daviesbacteria bacterium RIFCSPLOWO2_01_FULL_43_38]OGE70487.1 MAG: hypothetical protein A3J21_00190 [Candidatus Daviesbacteria bacterium RIFCSPLOWO2_02_FULL_43_11]
MFTLLTAKAWENSARREVGLLAQDFLPGDGTPSAINAGSPWCKSLARFTPFVPSEQLYTL